MKEEEEDLINGDGEDFALPEAILDKMYEMTGGDSKTRGFVLFYITDKGNVFITKKSGSAVAELALDMTIEKYSKDEG